MSDDDDALPEDFADLDDGDDDDLFGESLPSEPSAGPAAKAPSPSPSKAPSKPPSKAPSKAPSELGAEDSLFASGSLLASRPASKAPSVAESFGRSHDALAEPSRSTPPPLVGTAPGSRAASVRGSKAGSVGRPASPLGTTPSDDFAELLGPSPERSAASLPRGGGGGGGGGPPSTSGSGFGAPAGGPASANSGSRPGTASRFSPAAASSVAASLPGGAGSRAGSLSGFGASESSIGRGSMARGGLAPPEASPSPRASGAATPRAHFAAGVAGGGGGAGAAATAAAGARPLLRNDRSRRSNVECHIPTPFELFRCYDMDFNGRVTREEFYDMMRDLDGLPLHYCPHDDPEHRLVGLKAKRQSKASELAAREEKLALAEMHRQATEAFKRELGREVAELAGKVAELDAKIDEEEKAARALTMHPDGSVRVTAELRQHRVQWRKWVSEEFIRADLAGNGILSIDEFYMYFYSKLCFRFPVMRTGVNPGALLFNIFVRYCSLGRGAVGGRYEDMLCHQFAKLCRDAGLVNGKTLTKATVDIVYHRARAADESLETFKHKAGVAATARMYYPQFLFALDKIADKRRSGFQEVVAKVLSSIDTLPEPSFADFLIISGNELEAGAPGYVNLTLEAQVPEFLTRHSLLPDNRSALRALADNDMIRKMKEESRDALNLSMGLVPKPEGEGGLKAFLDSKRTGDGQRGDGQQPGDGATATAAVAAATAAAAAPQATPAVQASVYGSLPPPSLGPETLRQKKWERPEPSDLSQSRAAALARGMAPVLSPDTMHLVRGLDPDQLMASLKRVYEAYTTWGGGVDRAALDRRRFAKMLRDGMLVSESGALPLRKAEAVYDKVLPASSRALNFLQFIEALRHVALHHRLSLNEVMERVVAVGSPRPGP